MKQEVVKSKQAKSTSVRISDAYLNKIKSYCKERGYKIGEFIGLAVVNLINNETKV
jgi:hypothetical protein